MPIGTPDTNRRTIVARLEREGWANKGGGNHDVFEHPALGSLAVPRHRDLSLGVARSITKRAGW